MAKLARGFVVLLCALFIFSAANAQSDYRVSRPPGASAVPAVMLVSGCSGFVSFNGLNLYDFRAAELVAAGYAVIYVDYLGKRGMTTCGGGNPSHEDIGRDLIAAAAWAAGQSWVDKRRIYAIGWSYGGGGLMAALAQAPAGTAPFAKAIMYYPDCRNARGWSAVVPSLMFLAAIDDQTPPELCKSAIGGTPANLLRAVTYPNARHGFDAHSLPERQALRSGTIGYNAPAAQASWQEVRAFLR